MKFDLVFLRTGELDGILKPNSVDKHKGRIYRCRKNEERVGAKMSRLKCLDDHLLFSVV